MGNFWQNRFLDVLALEYNNNDISLLTFNLTCHDCISEGYINNDEFQYIGGSISDFNTCLEDIGAAVKFARQHSDNIILQGHSLGCDRVLHYLISKGSTYPFILLSPCDSYQLQMKWLSNETVEKQIKRLENEKIKSVIFDWLDEKEYGVKSSDEFYYLPITRNALLSIMKGPPFYLMRLDKPRDFYLDQSAIVYIGGLDSLQASLSSEMFEYLDSRIENMKKIYFKGGKHDLENCESEVATSLAKWANELEGGG